jgi:hypothetical protein
MRGEEEEGFSESGSAAAKPAPSANGKKALPHDRREEQRRVRQSGAARECMDAKERREAKERRAMVFLRKTARGERHLLAAEPSSLIDRND